tara:strand:- start:547 stop:2295 length:1749 start_codon:yes stop_codon:yes gene_type:complete
MKILESLNKYNIIFFLIINLVSYNSVANEPIDIWNIDQKNTTAESTGQPISESNNESSIYKMQTSKTTDIQIIKEEPTSYKKIKLAGIYDPEEFDLSLYMWTYSNGKIIKSILNKIDKINLSEDSMEMLNVALLTNSYFPKKNLTSEEFLKFKSDYLIKTENLNLIRLYLSKNKDVDNKDTLIKYYLNEHLSSANLEKACDIFDVVKNYSDDYISKFHIYCLYNSEKNNEAQLLFDLKKELGLKDKFFENKFNILMGYNLENNNKLSEKNILEFHLSHRTNKDFSYSPNEKTKKIIWQYLSASNLLEETSLVDLENIKKIKLIEKATHEGNYKEKDLLELYKRFQFSIDQLLNSSEVYKLLPSYEARALIYQKLLLSNSAEEKLFLSSKLKELFIKDQIENAFNIELSKILKDINTVDITSEYSLFYEKNLLAEKKDVKLTFNNKIIHQSKLLKHFIEDKEIKKTQKETNDFLKKIRKNKKYYFTTKDIILLESLKSDGIEIDEKNQELYEKIDPDIPYDIQIMINNRETGLFLLRLVEIIGEDKLTDLGTETLYFIVIALNQLNLDTLRDKILLKVLPLKV